jgi:hypothetical protein
MDSQKPPAAATAPSHRKKHSHSSSLGSLYEVLADLDESQLQYLVQEMNHTDHKNLSVSEAVSTFEAQGPPEPKNLIARYSVLPSTEAPQSELSKSQKGKLRLQTAFQRTPSLRQGLLKGNNDTDLTIDKTRKVPGQETSISPSPIEAVRASSLPVIQTSTVDNGLLKSTRTPSIDARTVENRPLRPNTTTKRGKSPAYRRIPRPDFQLPAGVTVADLLRLLEIEFLSANPHNRSPGSSISPSFDSPTHLIPTPLPLSPESPSSSPNIPRSRPLRKVSSRLDMALEAERTVSGMEEIGLGMLEPRQQKPAFQKLPVLGDPISLLNPTDNRLNSETPAPVTTPVVLEGIFDVLENY